MYSILSSKRNRMPMDWKRSILERLWVCNCKCLKDYKKHLTGPRLEMAEYMIEKGLLTQDDITWK